MGTDLSGNTYGRTLKDAIDWKLIICYLLLIFILRVDQYLCVHSLLRTVFHIRLELQKRQAGYLDTECLRP